MLEDFQPGPSFYPFWKKTKQKKKIDDFHSYAWNVLY